MTLLLWARIAMLMALAGAAACLIWCAWMDREPRGERRSPATPTAGRGRNGG